MPHGIHHLTFVARDLGASVRRWSALLRGPRGVATLANRSVQTARPNIGSAHVVLVQQAGYKGEPARILRERGEGLLRVSLGVTDLDAAIFAPQSRVVSADGPERIRRLGWRMRDLMRDQVDDVQLPMCQPEDSTRSGRS